MYRVLQVTAAVAAIAMVVPSLGNELNPQLMEYVHRRVSEFDKIEPTQREALEDLAEYVGERRQSDEAIRITFICTHNSRRSHLAQLWAATAAEFYGIANVETFSGGTEATAFNPRAVAALRRCGFEIPEPKPADNPRYEVAYAPESEPLICFSKMYGEDPNPRKDFCAVMTCSEADRKCPAVFGADRRITISYVDPKVADNTPQESQTYDGRCEQIAREMLYTLSFVSAAPAHSLGK